mgnify:CR=1 FL=1
MELAEASTVKVFGSELNIEGYNLLIEVLGAAGMIRRGSPEAAIGVRRMRRSSSV